VRLGRRKFSPLLALVLAALWLLLHQSVAAGDLVLGVALGSVLAWASSVLRPLQARISRWDLAARLAVTVLHDIVRSNVAVARIVLGLVPGNRPGFLHVPLELRDPHGLATLAIIITATPGTVWVGVSNGGETLTLHVLDLENEARWVRFIKERYEQPLLRIFE
jgi:multicomponent K+:H+ antiporter subunit E